MWGATISGLFVALNPTEARFATECGLASWLQPAPANGEVRAVGSGFRRGSNTPHPKGSTGKLHDCESTSGRRKNTPGKFVGSQRTSGPAVAIGGKHRESFGKLHAQSPTAVLRVAKIGALVDSRCQLRLQRSLTERWASGHLAKAHLAGTGWNRLRR